MSTISDWRPPIDLPISRGYACVGLDNPKNTINIGGVLRAAWAFGAVSVAISGGRAVSHIGRIPSDTGKAVRRIPVLLVEDLQSVVPYDCVPVAVDLVEGAIPLPEYEHPVRAFYIFGAEDATLGKRVLFWCRDTIEIPGRQCMNLAATVNVVLYDRMAKESRRTQ